MSMYYGSANCFDSDILAYVLESSKRGIGKPELITKYMTINGNSICWKNYDETNRPYYMELRVDGIPVQCGMALMYSMDFYRMDDPERLKQAWNDIEAIFKALRYSSIMATTNSNQEQIKKCLEAIGFKETFTWKNKRSGNQCFQLVKEIALED